MIPVVVTQLPSLANLNVAAVHEFIEESLGLNTKNQQSKSGVSVHLRAPQRSKQQPTSTRKKTP